MANTEILKEFHSKYPKYQVVFLHISGSKLYGTDLPSSDTDYRGIFVPPLEALITKTDIEQWTSSTGNKSSKNSENDVDISLWSIHKFIKLLQVGDTNAFDTLFAYKTHAELLREPLMDKLYDQRELYYPESLRSFFGYALGQVKKYSVKGDKLRDVQVIKKQVELLLEVLPEETIGYLKDYVAVNENVQWVTDDTNSYIKILDKRFIQTVRLSEFLEKLQEIESKYGERAKAAKDNQSVDWKALYHSFRVLDECHELMNTGRIKFPLESSYFLKRVRNQTYTPNDCFEKLEYTYNIVSEFEKSDKNYLKRVTRGSADSLLLEYYGNLPSRRLSP